MHEHSSHQLPQDSISEWLPLALIGFAVILYIYGVIRLSNRNVKWNIWLSISFMVGLSLVSIAMIPTITQWAHHDLRGHMVQHLLIGMFAPIFLVLGAPFTLALKTLPRQLSLCLTYLLRTKIFHFISQPITALLLNIGGMYILYLTPLYHLTLTNPVLHHLIHIHFLAAGYLFTWSIIGPDPAPGRPKLSLRLVVLFVSIAAHGFLSKIMYAHLYPLNSPHGAEEIQEAAKLMYYWGDLSELLLIIFLFTIWYKKRGRPKYDLAPLFSWS